MKATVEFKEAVEGIVECHVNILAGTATPREAAYMQEFIAAFKIVALDFGKKRAATCIVLDPNAKPTNQ